MPSRKTCSKIKDPAKRKRCNSYTGEYSKNGKKYMSNAVMRRKWNNSDNG
tara:strand:+ start:1721 stop:1870 length:150 start_codon:yes stop_codon:yes gene_type:complete